MTEYEPEMKKIFGSGVPDDYLKLRASRGQFQGYKGTSNWQFVINQVGEHLGRKDYKLLGIRVAKYTKDTAKIMECIKKSKEGNNPKALFWWLVKQK